jgi:hypothetical protein
MNRGFLAFVLFAMISALACSAPLATERARLAAGPFTIHLSPFTMRAGSPDDAWIGSSLERVIAREWKERVRFTDRAEESDRAIVGEYWVRDNRLIVAAAVHRGLFVAPRRQWEIPLDREELVIATFRAIAGDLESDFGR